MTLWLLYIASCLLYSLNKIEIRKKRPDYTVAIIWRVFFGIVICIVVNPFLDPGNPFTLLPAWPFAAWQISSFYLLFDPSLNLLRGKPLFYRGKDSGTLDSLPLWAYYALKIICLIALIVTTIILIQ
jgi:hypothetical protein